MAIYHHTTRMIGRSGGGSPVKALSYITGVAISDERTGEVFDFKNKSVEEVRILLPENAPQWAKDLQKLVSQKLVSRKLSSDDKDLDNRDLNYRDRGIQILSDIANAAEKRIDAQVYREIEFSLPRELTYEQNRQLAGEYVQDQFCGLGMLAIQSFHVERDEKTGELNPHCHTFLLTRELREEGLAFKKNREWNQRSLHENWREQWAQYANFHLKMHGHDIVLDHRSYKDQGLDIEPQVKLGKGVKEQEKRAKANENMGDIHLDQDLRNRDSDQGVDPRSSNESKSKLSSMQGKGFVENIPATDRAQELRSIQLRNLYRIVRRPEVVLDIVSKHHATFMWGDVQKILGRYVDELSLFQRLEAKLKISVELITLKSDKTGDDVYTTRSQLRSEKSLVETAEELGRAKGHGVKEQSVVQALAKANEDLKAFGRLSLDQQKAIYHLVDGSQLKCVVGIAGAGKTTALGVCRDIWTAEGYSVYGLAPTGKAAQNLEQSGIQSSTLHKFLKSFEEGRCQYTPNSVLVLDEAGMVDMERFEGLLGAVKQLGVKLIVVGDGAQLQPVEAGPAFRLVTNRLGKAELNTVLRQKEEWQREATILFGRQDTQKAIEAYADKGHIHIVRESIVSNGLSSLHEAISNGNGQEVLNLYETSTRVSSLMYREMAQDINKTHPQTTNVYGHIKDHQDFKSYLEWRGIQKEAAKEILEKGDAYRPLLEDRSLDPTKMAMLFVDKKQDKGAENALARALLEKHGLESLMGLPMKKGLGIDVRQSTKEALITAWHDGFKFSLKRVPLGATGEISSSRELLSRELSSRESCLRDTSVMLAFSNRDVHDLNHLARSLLKKSGYLSKEDFTYTIAKMAEDDFGTKSTKREEKNFSRGDRIVFTRNNYDLGVKNGSMGTIMDLNKQNLQVKLDGDEEKDISFAPHLNPYFDQGWAITIHKSQGTTVDRTYLLASYEMNQNLTYVAMTRHKEDVQVFASSLDFWRSEKLPEVLSKSGEKLAGTDYLDADSLNKLMQQDDHIITRIFNRLSNELEAMGAVSKRLFWHTADHFLGIRREKDIRVGPEFSQDSIREEVRASEILQKLSGEPPVSPSRRAIENNQEKPRVSHEDPLEMGSDRQDMLKKQSLKDNLRINRTLQDVYEDWTHPAFRHANFYKRVFEEGLKIHGEESSVKYWNEKRAPYLKQFEDKIEQVEKALASPLLSYMSDESRNLARKAALEDPDRALAFFAQLKASKQSEKDALTKAQQISSSLPKDGPPRDTLSKDSSLSSNHSLSPSWRQEDEALQRNAQGTVSSYLKFKELHYEQQKSPYDSDLKKELRNLSKDIFKNKEMFGQIEGLDPEISNLIKEKALEKIRELNRGGFSL